MRKKTLIFSSLAVAALLTGAAVANHGGKHGHHGGHGERAERMFERFDSNGDGAVTLEEAKAHAAARFMKADANGDGELSRGERIDARDMMRSERKAARFARIDANGDGAISRDEMNAMAMERAGKRFERIDANSDGAISAEEMSEARGMRGGKRGEGHGKGHGRGMRGANTLEEVDARVTAMFHRMDADKDGAVTLEEVKAARADRKKP